MQKNKIWDMRFYFGLPRRSEKINKASWKPKPEPSKNWQKSRNREVSKPKCQSLSHIGKKIHFFGTLYLLVFLCVFHDICILYLSYGGRVESEVWRGRGGSKRYNRQAAVSYNGQQGCLTMGRAYAITPLQVIQVIRIHAHKHTLIHRHTKHIYTHKHNHTECRNVLL